jgi:hypothetical protein
MPEIAAAAVSGSLDDAVMRELAYRSPTPMPLSLPPGMIPQPILVPSPSPAEGKVAEPEGTPSYDQILALAEPTIVDHTLYALEDEHEPSIPIDEASRSIALGSKTPDPSRLAKTPLTSVRPSEDVPPAPRPRKKTWQMVAFVAATALVAWAVFRYGGGAAPKAPESAPPPANDVPAPRADEGAYTNVAPDAKLAAGQGMLELFAPQEATVYVDGAERGHGGTTLSLWPGSHDVRIKSPAGEDAKTVEVRASKVVHLKF